MSFNADEYLKALQPPAITVGGETYTGKLLSFEEMLPLQARFEAMQGDEVDLGVVKDLARELCEAIDIPADKVLALPAAAVVAALSDFLACLVAGNVGSPTPTKS